MWDQRLYQDLISQRLTMGLMSSIVSIGTVILQSAINKLGMTIIECPNLSSSDHVLCSSTNDCYFSSMTTFTSQNFGAKAIPTRIQQRRQTSLSPLLLWSVFVAILLFFTSPFLTSLISGSTNPNLIANASLYLKSAPASIRS